MLNEQYQPVVAKALYVLMVLMVLVGIRQAVVAYYTAHPVPSNLQERTVTFSASGKAVGVPDVAKLTMSVIEEGDSVAIVTEAGNEKMNAIIGVVKGSGVEETDIRTTSYRLQPVYNYKTQPYEIEKYSLTQAVTVTVRNFDDIALLIDQTTKAGANSVSTPVFEIDDPETVKTEAREEAFAKVTAKAQAMAEVTGVTLGDIVTFSEDANDYGRYEYDYALSEDSLSVSKELPSIEPGSEEVTVTVSVTYELTS